MQDTSVATLNERIAQFMIEYYQGIDPAWLILKYGFDGLLEMKDGRVYASNNEGVNLIRRLQSPDPRDLFLARQQQTLHPDKYPWHSNPKRTLPHADHPQEV